MTDFPRIGLVRIDGRFILMNSPPVITISPKTSDFLRLQSYGIPNNKDDTIKANIQKAMVRFFCFISSMINVM